MKNRNLDQKSTIFQKKERNINQKPKFLPKIDILAKNEFKFKIMPLTLLTYYIHNIYVY